MREPVKGVFLSTECGSWEWPLYITLTIQISVLTPPCTNFVLGNIWHPVAKSTDSNPASSTTWSLQRAFWKLSERFGDAFCRYHSTWSSSCLCSWCKTKQSVFHSFAYHDEHDCPPWKECCNLLAELSLHQLLTSYVRLLLKNWIFQFVSSTYLPESFRAFTAGFRAWTNTRMAFCRHTTESLAVMGDRLYLFASQD